MAPAIQIENLSFSYNKHDKILDIDSFQVESGEHVFLHGPSGSGKTSLLALISGITAAQSGKLSVLGTDLAQLSLRQRDRFRGENLGYIFQMFNLIPYLNVRENILLPLKMNPKKRQNCPDPESELSFLLDNLELGQLSTRPVSELSIGQQQRVAAARSLIGSPPLIIADEPTSALDYDNRERFIELLFRSAKKSQATIVFVSHDHSLAKLFPRNVPLTSINRAGAKS